MPWPPGWSYRSCVGPSALSAPRAAEAVAVLLLTGVAIAEVTADPQRTGPIGLHVAVVGLLGAAVLLRGEIRVAAPVLAAVAVVVQCTVGFAASAGELVLYLLLVGAAAATRRAHERALALTAVTGGFLAVLLADPTIATLRSALPGMVMFGAAAGAGAVLRRRTVAGEERAEASERRAAQALADERSRIARELHDVVTHSLSVVVVQAGAARLDAPPEQAAHLAAIEGTARSALEEMRRLLGVLRGAEDAELQPQPGLDQLPVLVEQMRRSGLDVHLRHNGDPQPLPPGLDLAAYRVIQEALTNVLRHAQARRAEIRFDWQPNLLGLAVVDDGTGAAGPPGRGLIGMSERVALYGGRVTAGSGTHGGFTVSAELPLVDARAGAR
jgi:signal transduction histidine kinase